ncbi:MAG: UDP-3-O-acyl-N-acetylglucosamine deacetylase [Nitrospinota bacterium]|nr:UDP-3-O-acyl-N-acetylglucosamine deacetylase [Nitrospinota bacterium]
MNKGKILVVDDEENIRGALYDILTDEGYSVSLAEDGETALRMIRAEAPHLVLLDIWIPGIDGIQTLKILKKMSSGTEVVVMSGHGAIDTAVKATKLGAFDFIEKPFSLETILKSVAGALAAREEAEPLAPKKPASGPYSMESWFSGPSILAAGTRSAIENAAKRNGPILITGPVGSGKEFAARLIHDKGEGGRFIKVECDSLTDENYRETIFGLPAKGAGWSGNGLGLAAQARGGTLFLDKLSSLSLKLQRKLAKSLTDKLPASSEQDAIRVIGAALEKGKNVPILSKPLAGYFGGASVTISSLAERPEDIPELVERLVRGLAEKYSKRIEKIDSDLIDSIGRTVFKGNTRELYNFLELVVLACEGVDLTGEYISIAGKGSFAPSHADEGKNEKTKKEKAADEAAALARTGAGQPGKKLETRQRTLKNSVVLCGEGLHSGLKTGIILSPLPPHSGIVFWDISSGQSMPALIENVRSTDYSTTLASGDVVIKTVEHILSALHSYRISNLLIKIGDEAPIMDGSAIEFCQIIEKGGIEEQDAVLEPIIIDRALSVGDPISGSYLAVEPSDGFSVHYFLDYPQPIGEQDHFYSYESGSHYKGTIAPARTFGFLKDIRVLEEAGLASGGRLSNVILIDDEKVINTPLRFDNEPARHKILDLIGDLFLLGRPVQGHFIARKSGHTQNIAMVEKILESCARSGSPADKYQVAGGGKA